MNCKTSVRIDRFAIGIIAGCLCGMLNLSAQQQQRPQTGGQARATGSGGGSSTRQYYPNGTIGDATITADPETRRLIVITDEETGDYVSQVVTNLDRPKPQVLIKVVFLQVTHNDGSDIGVEGTFRKQMNNDPTFGTISNLFGLTPGLPGSPSSIPTPPGAGIYQILSQDYTVTLYAIARAGKTEILSRPSILTRNNQQATITVGQSVPIITGTIFSGTAAIPVNTIQYQNVGVILRVTPFITSEGLVEMILAPQISNLSDQTVNISVGVNVPVIDIRSADTVVVTPHAQTVVIGGLMGTQKAEVVSKIPFLGDLPLLGAAFRRTVKNTVKTELIIFLTPYIVMEPTQLAALTTQERGASPMVDKAFTEKELNQFLDTLPSNGNGSNKSKK
jgi:general secretion pathway protein D